MPDTIDLEIQDAIWIVRLNRPAVLNAIDLKMRQELAEIVREIKQSSECSTVVLSSIGGNFCAGGDLQALMEVRDAFSGKKRTLAIHDWYSQLMFLDRVVISAIEGVAFGGGWNLALAADFVVCSETAKFSQAFSRIGLIPDFAGLFTLPRIVGLQMAKELMFTARTLGAEEAKKVGLVYEVTKEGDAEKRAIELATRFVGAPIEAIGMMKAILLESFNTDWRAIAEMESSAQGICLASSYHKTALERFAEKLPFQFKW